MVTHCRPGYSGRRTTLCWVLCLTDRIWGWHGGWWWWRMLQLEAVTACLRVLVWWYTLRHLLAWHRGPDIFVTDVTNLYVTNSISANLFCFIFYCFYSKRVFFHNPIKLLLTIIIKGFLLCIPRWYQAKFFFSC